MPVVLVFGYGLILGPPPLAEPLALWLEPLPSWMTRNSIHRTCSPNSRSDYRCHSTVPVSRPTQRHPARQIEWSISAPRMSSPWYPIVALSSKPRN